MGLSIYQWKMLLNPDINKKATEVYFSQRCEKTLRPPIIFLLARRIWVLSSLVSLVSMRMFSLRKQLLAIYNTFVRPHLGHTDIIYNNKPFNYSFKEELEKVQYFAALIINGVVKGTSRERLYKELGLKSLSDRRWYRKPVFFYKIVKVLAPSYLQSYLLPDDERTYNRSSLRNTIKTFATRTSTFRATIFSCATGKWNQLNDCFKKIVSIWKFKNTLIEFIKTKGNSIFGVSDIYCIKLLTRLGILTGKKHPKIKLQRLRKKRIWTFWSLIHQINSF